MPWKNGFPAAAALAAALCAGCDNARPGAGLTNGPAPSVVGAEDKPAVRTDLQQPDATGGDAAIAASAEPAAGPAPSDSAVPAGGGATPGTAGGASPRGADKPAGDIKVGTPHSPQ